MNGLDTTLNRAIDTRDALEKSAASESANGESHAALDKLNRDIDDLVDLRIQSGEGALVYPGRLRPWLSAITGQLDMALVAPTPAMVQVANGYVRDASAGMTRLETDLVAARVVVP